MDPGALLAGSFRAFADPILTISSSFAFRDLYAIEFSPNMVAAAPIPEPETYAMMLAGLGLLAFANRRRAKRATAA